MDPVITKHESAKLKATIEQIKQSKSDLEKLMNNLGISNLQALKEMREDPDAGMDFFMFMEQLHEKNEALNIKDKYKQLEELEFLLKEPYFSRIDLLEAGNKKAHEIYIGKFGFFDKEPVVTDWRTRVASVYYRYRYPQKNVKYETDLGVETRDLTLKRTFEIDDGELIKYYNNDIQLDENEIISDKIEQRTGGVLEDIVETIQLSQLDIIEADPRQVCVVQGCVGSGKSTVAIHKLAHIFFNFPNLIHAEKSILITKNQILIGYLSTLFPKLGIFDIYYKTLRELIVHIVFREDLKLQIDLDADQDTSGYDLKKIKSLQAMVAKVHTNVKDQLDKLFENEEFASFASFKYAPESTPYTNLTEIITDLEEEVVMQREFIKENPDHPRAWLYKENIKTIRKLRNKLGELRNEVKHTTLNDLVKELKINYHGKIGYREALLYVYLYAELVGITKFPTFEYCVVDEGQDFSILEYLVLSKFVTRGRFAIFGDLNQSLESDGILNWKDIPEVIAEAKTASIFELGTNYRSTKPIIDLANKVLGKYTKDYLPKSINRHGQQPFIEIAPSTAEMLKIFDKEITSEVSELNKSIGVIAFGDELFNQVGKILEKKGIDSEKLIRLDSSKKINYIPKGVYYMKFEDCKGLEFAKVYVLGLNLNKIKDYPEARKAFVAITRAMNELRIYGTS